MATIPDVADALVEVLNDADLSIEFVAIREYRPIVELKDISTLRVTVVPVDQELILADRTLGQSDIRIDVGVQKKLSVGDNEEIDVLIGFVEELIILIRETRAFGVARWFKTENSPIVDHEHLIELGLFTSVLNVTMRVIS